MSINNDFKNVVQEQDILSIRVMLKNSMWRDPTFKDFNELLDYAKKNVDNLYDEHDGEVFVEDKNQWNKELLALQQAKCLSNFSHERVIYLRKLCKYLYADKIEAIKNERIMASIEQKNKKEKQKKIIIAGAGVGTLVAGAVAVGALSAYAALATTSAVAIGYALVKDKEE